MPAYVHSISARTESSPRMCYRFSHADALLVSDEAHKSAIITSSLQDHKKPMAERPVFVGVIPQTVEFDVNRCPFSSNVFQAPAGMRLLSGPARPGIKAATFKYRLWLNDQLVGQGEVILREK